MTERPCVRKTCFYCVDSQCSNIAVSVIDECELFLDFTAKKPRRSLNLMKPSFFEKNSDHDTIDEDAAP